MIGRVLSLTGQRDMQRYDIRLLLDRLERDKCPIALDSRPWWIVKQDTHAPRLGITGHDRSHMTNSGQRFATTQGNGDQRDQNVLGN